MGFAKHAYKKFAYQRNARIYRELTGNACIPTDGQYWTLANVQEEEDGEVPEITYYERLGFLTKEQFHGVDKVPDFIDLNRRMYPTAHWHVGDWNDVISTYVDFRPSCIYLDTNCWADRYTALRLVSRTLLLAPVHTVVFVNVMVNDPRGGFVIDLEKLMTEISHEIPPEELENWFEPDKPMLVDSYTYNSKYTEMRNFIFFRRR